MLANSGSGVFCSASVKELESFVKAVRVALDQAGGEGLEQCGHRIRARELCGRGHGARNAAEVLPCGRVPASECSDSDHIQLGGIAEAVEKGSVLLELARHSRVQHDLRAIRSALVRGCVIVTSRWSAGPAVPTTRMSGRRLVAQRWTRL